MALGTLRTLVREIVDNVYGVPISITRTTPDEGPIETVGTWVPALASGQVYGTEMNGREAGRVMVIGRNADLPDIPRNSRISAPEELGGTARTWKVEGYDSLPSVDRFRVVLFPVSDLL